ncbi:MAG: hypothetical protein JRI68_17540 [Deltaproteobacteria bacterium]|nr:hypothetical protein [Deltaproteobacteria bacterium]
MTDLSIPCPSCQAPIGVGRRSCPGCGAEVPAEHRAALLERLEAADEDYREACERQRRAAVVVLLVALVHLAWFALQLALRRSYLVDDGGVEALPTPQSVAVGLLLLGAFLVSRRAAVTGLAGALAIWVGAQVTLAAMVPAALLASFLSLSGVALLFGKVVVLVMLLRGLLAALAARATERRRAEPARPG